MPARTELLDLGTLSLVAGQGRHLDLVVAIASLALAGQTYAAEPKQVAVRLDVSRMTGDGYALRMRFTTAVSGPCVRCLEPAAPAVVVDAREVDQPGEGDDELASPYVDRQVLDLAAWAHDAFALAAPDQVLCRPNCLGLCPECAANLNDAGPQHHHDRPPDPRWAKLRDLRLD